MPVVIDNGFGGVLFHEACGHSLEATQVAYGISEFSASWPADCPRPASPPWTTAPWKTSGAPCTWTTKAPPTTRLVLIENGILKNYMIDKLGGRRMNMAPTGSDAGRATPGRPPAVCCNTYIAPGQDDEAEMIATMGDGLYAGAWAAAR